VTKPHEVLTFLLKLHVHQLDAINIMVEVHFLQREFDFCSFLGIVLNYFSVVECLAACTRMKFQTLFFTVNGLQYLIFYLGSMTFLIS
jgi:hypothetical protein